MAFLDIMPLSPGHLLVTTRKHHEKISDVTEEEAKELGSWLPRLSRVLANVTGVWDWNIVQNNGRIPVFRSILMLDWSSGENTVRTNTDLGI
jgi:diadenosine tetraphosphate (Ap4A) HIT family hydrolase